MRSCLSFIKSHKEAQCCYDRRNSSHKQVAVFQLINTACQPRKSDQQIYILLSHLLVPPQWICGNPVYRTVLILLTIVLKCARNVKRGFPDIKPGFRDARHGFPHAMHVFPDARHGCPHAMHEYPHARHGFREHLPSAGNTGEKKKHPA